MHTINININSKTKPKMADLAATKLEEMKRILHQQKKWMSDRLTDEASLSIDNQSLEFIGMMYRMAQDNSSESKMMYEIFHTLSLVLGLIKYEDDINEFLLKLMNHPVQTVESLKTLINVKEIPDDKLKVLSMAFLLYTDHSGLTFCGEFSGYTDDPVLSRVLYAMMVLKE